MIASTDHLAVVLIELGLVVLALALLARLAHRFGLSPIPLYLLAGLAVGQEGIIKLDVSRDFVDTGAEIGVMLLLLALGLQFTAAELRTGLRTGWPSGLVDGALNFTPGLLAGLVLGWSPGASLLLGGVTYISSSGIISKLLGDLGRLANRETPVILTILVIEDLVMAVYLPIAAIVAAGQMLTVGSAAAAGGAFLAAAAALYFALRHGRHVSKVVTSSSDEVVLLSVIGLTLFVAGVAQYVGVSAAVGAFLIGIAVAGPVADRAAVLVGPLRDLFAAIFFFLFGLQVDPSGLGSVLVPALALAVLTGGTKLATGYWAARRAGIARSGRIRAGTALIARGEFSIIIAELGLASGIEPQLGQLAAAYVLILAVAGPLITRLSPTTSRSHKPTG